MAKQAFMQGLADAFEQRTGIRVEVTGSDSTASIRDTVTGKNDIGGACRVTQESDPVERKAHQIPVAWDALVVVVNPDNPLNSISLTQLRALYRGELDDWQWLNDRPLPIERVGLQHPADLESVLAQLLYDEEGGELFIERRLDSPVQILDAVEMNEQAIAVVSLAEAKGRDVKILAVDEVLPDYESIRYGDYPLARPLYLITRYQKQQRHVQRFVRFAVSREGQDVIRRLGTVPYAEAITLVMRQHQRSVRSGGRRLFRNRASLN